MARQPTAAKCALSDFIQSLPGCSASELLRLLKSGETQPQFSLVVSLTMLLSKEPGGQRPPDDLVQVPLDAIAASGEPFAEQALCLLTAKAQNSRLRIEAAKRLGRVASHKESHELLWHLAQEGKAAPQSYVGDSVSTDMIKEAALLSLADLKRPGKADGDIVFGVLSLHVGKGEDTPVFRAGAKALRAVAKAADIPRILDLAGKCKDPHMTARIVSVYSRFARATILKQSDHLIPLFVRSLDRYQDEKELHELAIELARRLACPQLVKELREHYGGDSLDQGRGQVIAAALESYGEIDDPLADAYLGFAHAEHNAHEHSACFAGLKRCAQARKLSHIIRNLVNHCSSPGCRRLLISGNILKLAGTMPSSVKGICDALSGLTDQSRRKDAARLCVVGLLRATLKDVEEVPFFEDLAQLRQRSQQVSRREDSPVGTLAARLTGLAHEASALHWLAREIASDEVSQGAVELAHCLLSSDDELSHLLIDQVLEVAFACKNPAQLPPESNLRRFEDVAFAVSDRWLRSVLPKHLIAENRLNRYTLDVMRRKHVEFAPQAQKALGQVEAAEDAMSVLDALFIEHSEESTHTLAKAAGFVSDLIAEVSPVRERALSLIRRLSAEGTARLSARLEAEILKQIHPRFEDARDVRFAAYDVAEALASPESIRPLRSRRSTDADPRANQKIDAALQSIQKRLVSQRPKWENSDVLISWLEHVGDLGDDVLVESVAEILTRPHPDRQVIIAALNSLSNLKSRKAIPFIDKFMTETSPSGDVLQAARYAKAVIQERKDLPLFEALTAAFPNDSTVFSIGVDYHAVFGARLQRVARFITDAMDQYHSGHWDDFVTKLDGVCDLIVRHIFEQYPQLLAMEKTRAQNMAGRQYANRLGVSEFQVAFTSVQPLLASIHAMRDEATTAHGEDSDGTEKTGLGESDANLALDQFRTAFEKLITKLGGGQDTRTEQT